MSWRRLRVLIENLPPESATWTAMRNALSDEQLAEQAGKGEPEKGRWSQTEQLIALVADRVAELTFAFSTAHADKGKKPKPPDPVRRPGSKPLKPKARLNENTAGLLADWLQLSAG